MTVFMDVYSFDTQTHNLFSNRAIQLSKLDLDPQLLLAFGINSNTEISQLPGIVPVDPNGSDPNDTVFLENTSIARIVTGGSVLEDASTRPLHHFFDPQNGEIGGSKGLPSPVWILESTITGETGREFTLLNQVFSYRDAMAYFHLGLTSADTESRRENLGLMFRSLGHVIHHLQDMAQPQHVRNDQHCDALTDFPGVAFFCLITGMHNPSYYENFTTGRVVNDNNLLTPVSADIPTYSSARDYWDNAEGNGIAQYTSRNFVSDGTNYISNDDGELISHPDFTNPQPLTPLITVSLDELFSEAPELSKVQIELILLRLGCEKNPCLIDMIQNGILENDSGVIVNPRSSTLSIFDAEIRVRNLEITNTFLSTYVTRRVTSLNRFNFEATYPFLLPRAVAYSAGLLNHFFRGRLKVEGIGWLDENNISVTIKNISEHGNDLRQGIFEVYYESSDGTRLPVESVSLQENRLPLVANSSISLSFENPDNLDETHEEPYAVLFNGINGVIGNDLGLAAVRFKQPVKGTVQNLFLVADECPSKRFVVMINFDEQPDNNGQVLLKGVDSGATFDFRDVPFGQSKFIQNIQFSHRANQLTGKYEYQVAVPPPAFDQEDVCNTPSLGPWKGGEDVIPLNPVLIE